MNAHGPTTIRADGYGDDYSMYSGSIDLGASNVGSDTTGHNTQNHSMQVHNSGSCTYSAPKSGNYCAVLALASSIPTVNESGFTIPPFFHVISFGSLAPPAYAGGISTPVVATAVATGTVQSCPFGICYGSFSVLGVTVSSSTIWQPSGSFPFTCSVAVVPSSTDGGFDPGPGPGDPCGIEGDEGPPPCGGSVDSRPHPQAAPSKPLLR